MMAMMALIFLKTATNTLALERRDVIDEELAVEMVNLVLDADGEQSVGLEFLSLAVAVECAHPHALGAGHGLVEAGHRETAFFHLLLALARENLGVDQTEGRVAVFGDVDDHDPALHADLNGGQSDARRGIHGFKHVVDEPLDTGIDPGNRLGRATQPRIGEGENIEHGHGVCRVSVNLANRWKESRRVRYSSRVRYSIGLLLYPLMGSGGSRFDCRGGTMRAPNPTLAFLLLASCGLLPSLSGAAPELLPNAPERYVVRPDDTLWGVAGRFLRDPWRWNELLVPSAALPDPEQLYPGDVLVLSKAGGEPRLSLIRGGSANAPASSGRDDIPVVRLSPKPRVTGLKAELPSIPIAAIAPFLSQPYVADSDQLDQAAYVVGFPDEHLVAGRGDAVYARRLGASAGGNYQIVRPGDALRDPDSNDLLGYEAEFLASAVLERQGDPARLRITRSEREVGIGDRIIPAELDQPLENFLPRPAPSGSRARILSVMNGVSQIGQYDVVILNRGERDGIESGHLFEAFVGGAKERDPVRGRGFNWNWRDETPLSTEFWYGDFSFRGWREDAPHDNTGLPLHADLRPDRAHYLKPYERAGILMVFRVFERVSFALVLEATRAMGIGDRLAPPAT